MSGIGKKPAIDNTYPYHDENGKLLFEVVRFAGKDFRQRRPDGVGGWIWKLDGVQRVPYRLPQLLAADSATTIYITEGEKDADKLGALGLVVTTNPGGAGKWRDEYNVAFQGRHVVILPDNDEPGRRHAQQVAQALHRVAASVRVLALPNVPPKGDVTDWLATGGTAEALAQLVMRAPEWAAPEGPRQPRAGLQTTDAKALLATEFEEIHWVIPNLIAPGLTLLAGRPKAGKSWICLALAVAVAAGGRVFGSIPVEQGSVLYLALEDTKRRLKDRLLKVLGNGPVPEALEFVTVDNEFPRLHEGGVERIEAWLATHANARLIIIDTLKKVRPPQRVNGSVYDQDYDSVDALFRLAGQRGIGVFVVHHTRKASADDAIDEVSGSYGLTANVDGVLVFRRAQGAPDAVLHVTGRDVEEQELAVRWDAQLWQWNIIGNATEVRVSRQREGIQATIRAAGHALGPKEVTDELGVDDPTVKYDNIKSLMSKMARDGYLCAVERGKYDLPDHLGYLGYLSTSEAIESDPANTKGNQAPEARLPLDRVVMPQNGKGNQGNQGNHIAPEAAQRVETAYDRDMRLMKAARAALADGNVEGAKRKLAFIHGNKERSQIEAEIEACTAVV